MDWIPPPVTVKSDLMGGGMAQAIKTISNPESVARPMKAYYANAVRVRANELLFVSGQVAVDKDGKLVGPGDLRAQAHQVLENIRAILRANGAEMENVVKVTVYVTDIRAFDDIEDIRNEYFHKNPPTSVIVEVSKLAKPEWMIEIEAVAALE